MKKQTAILLSSIALVVFLSGVLCYLLFFAEEPKEETKIVEQEKEELFSVLPQDINIIKIKNPEDEYTLVNCQESFAVEGLEETKASKINMQTLLSLLDPMEAEREIVLEGEEINLNQYGLDKPEYSIQIVLTDGSEKTLFLGKIAPDGKSIYTQYEGKVYLMAEDILEIASKKRYSFLDNEITGMEPEYKEATIILSGENRALPITLKITTTTEGEVTEGVVSSSERKYEMLTPIEQEITAESASKVTDGLFSLYANTIVAVHPSEEDILSLGLEEPFSQIEFSADGEEGFTLKTSEPDENNYVYLMKEGGELIYWVSAGRLSWLDVQSEELTQSIYTAPELEKLKKFRIEARGSDYHFILEEEDGSIQISCEGLPVDAERFAEFYDKVTEIAPQKMYQERPDFEPALTMTITQKDGKQDVLQMIPIGDGNVSLCLNGKTEYAADQNLLYVILENCRSLLEGGDLKPLDS